MRKKCKKGMMCIIRNTKFEGKNYVGKFSKIYNSKIGFASYFGRSCFFISSEIGRFCSIGSNVCVIHGSHPINFVSTHPAFYSNNCTGLFFDNGLIFQEYKYSDSSQKYFVSIGNDVWIGNNCLILQGVSIGDGAIIAAGSVVTKNVEPYSIVGGVPAKIIKYRFEKKYIDKLMKLSWWNKDLDWIENNACNFSELDKLLEDK